MSSNGDDRETIAVIQKDCAPGRDEKQRIDVIDDDNILCESTAFPATTMGDDDDDDDANNAAPPLAPPTLPPPSYQDSIVDAIVGAASDLVASKPSSSAYYASGGVKRKAFEAGFGETSTRDDNEEGKEGAGAESDGKKRRIRRPALPTFESVDAIDLQVTRGSKRPLEEEEDGDDDNQESLRTTKPFRPTLPPSLDSTLLVDTLLDGRTHSSSLIDTSVETVFKALGINLTANVVTPTTTGGEGGFPRFRQSTPFNLFGIHGLEVALYTLDREDARLFELFYQRKAVFYALDLQRSGVRLGELSTWLNETVLGAVVLKDASIVYQSSTIDASLPPGLNIQATITVDNTSPELNAALDTLCGLQNPKLALRLHTPELPNWSSPLSFGTFAIDASIPDLAVSLIDNHLVLTSLAIRVHGYMATTSSSDCNVIFKRAYDWQLIGSMDVTLPSLPTRELDFTLSKQDSRWKLNLVLDVDWEDAFGIQGLVFENVAISSSVDTSTGWRSASFALAAELSLADTHVVIAGSFDFAGDFSISFSVLDLTWDTIIAVHGHFHPGEEKLVAPDILLSVRSATIAFSRSKGFLFDLEGLELGDYLGASATLAIGPEGGLLRMQVSGGILKLGELEVHNAGVSIAIGRHTTHSSTSSKALVKSSGKACWSLMLFGDLTWRDLQFSVAGRLYTTSEATGLQYTLACVLGTDTAKTGGGFSIDMLIPGIKDSILSDIVFKGVGVFVASMPETDLEILQRVPVGYQIKPGFQLVAEISSSERLSKALDCHNLGAILSLAYTSTDGSGTFIASLVTHNLPSIQIGKRFRTGDIAFQLEITGSSLSVKLVGTGYFKPEDDKPELIVAAHVSIGLTSFGIGGVVTGDWHNPFGMCRELVVGPQLGLDIALTYAGLVPTKFAVRAGGRWRDASLQLALQIGDNPLLWFEMHNIDIGKILEMIFDGELSVPPDFIFLETLKIYVSPRGAYLFDVYYKPGFSFDCSATILGKHGELHFLAVDGGVEASADIDPFDLGPFHVCGYDGKHLKFELKMGKVGNSCLISAQLKGLGLDVRLGGVCTLDPFYIYFDFQLKLSDSITLSAYIKPKAAGELPLTVTAGVDDDESSKGKVAEKQSTSKTVAVKNALGTGYELRATYTSSDCSSFLGSCIDSLRTLIREEIVSRIGWLSQIAAAIDFLLEKLKALLDMIQLRKLSLGADLDTQRESLVFDASVVVVVDGTTYAFCVSYDFSNQFKFIKDLVQKVKEFLVNAIDGIRRAVTDFATKAWNTLKDAANAFKKTVSSIVDKGLQILSTIGRYILRIWKKVLLSAIELTGVDRRKVCDTVNKLLPSDGLQVQPWDEGDRPSISIFVPDKNSEQQVYDLEFNLIAVKHSDGTIVDQRQIAHYQALEHAQGNTVDVGAFTARIPVPVVMDELEHACMEGLRKINEAVFNKMHDAIDRILQDSTVMHELDELSHELQAFGNRISEEFDSFVDGVERWGEEALEAGKHVVHEIEDFGEDVLEGGKKVVDGLGDMASELGSEMESLAGDAIEVLEGAQEMMGSMADDVEEVFDDAASITGHVVDGVNDFTDEVVNDVGDILDGVGDVTEELVDDVGEVLDSVGSAIGGLFDW